MSNYNIEKDIQNVLIDGEKVIFIAQQSRIRPGGSIVTPNKLYVTTHRIMYRNPTSLGLRAEINDFFYKDISNVRMGKGVMSREIFLKSRFHSDEQKLPAVSHTDSQILYQYISKGRIKGTLEEEPVYQNNQVVMNNSSFNPSVNNYVPPYNPQIAANNSYKQNYPDKNSSLMNNLNELKNEEIISFEELKILEDRVRNKFSNQGSTNLNTEQYTPQQTYSSSNNSPNFCNECGGQLNFIKEGPYQGEFVRLFKCNNCNKMQLRKNE